MIKLDEKLEAARKKLAELEAKKKAQEQRERAQAREKKRKAEVRAAVVMMALIRKDSETNESVAKYVRRVAELVTKPADVEALRDAGYLPAEAQAPQAVAKPAAPTEEDLIIAADAKKRFDEAIDAGIPASKLWSIVSQWENLTRQPFPGFSKQGRDAVGWPPHPLLR